MIGFIVKLKYLWLEKIVKLLFVRKNARDECDMFQSFEISEQTTDFSTLVVKGDNSREVTATCQWQALMNIPLH